MLLIIFVVHSQISIYFYDICMRVLNRVTLKCCSAEHHKGKWSGLQCSSQVKETPWSLSHLTLYYIEGTSVGKNPWRRLYNTALAKNLYSMSNLAKNWKWKRKTQEKFSFLAVVFTFILFCYSMHRNQTLTLKVLSLSVFKRHLDNALNNML